MSCAYARVRVAQSIVDLHFCRCVGGAGMNIRQETTFLGGVKDGNENKRGFGLTGRRGKMGMRALKRC